MPLSAAHRTFFKCLLTPHLIMRARGAITSENLSPLRTSSTLHFLRITKRNISFKNHSGRLREKIYSHHYSYIEKAFDKGCIDLCCKEGAILWRSETIPDLVIILKQGNQDFRDGEMELQLKQGSLILYYMGFTLAPKNSFCKKNEDGLMITRVQGSSEYLGVFKDIKDSLFDVAANHLLFAAIRGLAAYLGVNNIFGVGTKMQSYYVPERFERFDSCYSQFWESLMASKIVENFYQIPVPYVDKDIQLVAQHHRSRTRKKREFKKSVVDCVFNTIKQLNPYASNRLSNGWFIPRHQNND